MANIDIERRVVHAQKQVRAIFPSVEKAELDEQFRALLYAVLKKAELLENPGEREDCIACELNRAIRIAFEEYTPPRRILH